MMGKAGEVALFMRRKSGTAARGNLRKLELLELARRSPLFCPLTGQEQASATQVLFQRERVSLISV